MASSLVRPFRKGDELILESNLRAADRAEVELLSGSVTEAIRMSLSSADKIWTGTVDDEVACVFGVCPQSVLTRAGVPWMLGTELLDKYPLTMMKHALPQLAWMQNKYNYLTNMVDARNTRSIRWLKALGFRLLEPQRFGFYHTVIPFEWRAANV